MPREPNQSTWFDYGTATFLDSPLEYTLTQDVDSGCNSDKVFGLYVDYDATAGAEVDAVVPGLAAYFGGDMAKERNPFYASAGMVLHRCVNGRVKRSRLSQHMSTTLPFVH